MIIDRLSSHDLPDVAHLAEQLGYPSSVADLQSRFRNLQNSPECGIFIAKNETGKAIGFIQVILESNNLLGEARADITGLVVDQNERSLGVGAALLKQAEAWAKEKGLPLIRLRTNTKRVDAHRFYAKNGYELTKSQHLFSKTLIK